MRSLQRLGANRIELNRQPFRACTSFFLNALKWIEIAKYLALEHLRKKKGNLCRFHLLKVMNLLIVISQFPRRRPLSLTYVQASQYIYHLFGKSGSCTMMLAHYIESKHHSTSTTFSQSYHLRKGGSCTMILELFDVQASQYNYHLFRTAKIQCYQNKWQMYYDACSLYREQASQYNYHLFPFQANI